MTSVFSCVLPEEAAVGLVIRSKKLPPVGARFVPLEESRDTGLCCAASEERGVGFEVVVLGFGTDVVECLSAFEGASCAVEGSCFARDAAVGAVRCDGISIGFVTCRGFALEFGDGFVLGDLSEVVPDRAIDAAVGAVKETLLGFFAACLSAVAPGEPLAWLAEDVPVFAAGFVRGVVDTGTGLPFVLAFTFSLSALLGRCCLASSGFGLKSSTAGGNALPALTAFASVKSAGFMALGFSSAPVVGLSGFMGGSSALLARELCSAISESSAGCRSGVLIVLPAALSIAPSDTSIP